MSILLRRPLIAAVLGALVALAVVGGVVWARDGEKEAADKAAEFTGCFNLATGRLVVASVGPSRTVKCAEGQEAVFGSGSAVAVGVDGTVGEKGDSGADGKDGRDAEDGKDGRDGIRGEQGPAGVNGAPGPVGPKGDAGTPGAAGAKGEVGEKGEPGAPGRNGTSVLNGSGPPAATLGQPGDFYIDVESPERHLYGPRGADAWPGAATPLVTLSTYEVKSTEVSLPNATQPFTLVSDSCSDNARVVGGGLQIEPPPEGSGEREPYLEFNRLLETYPSSDSNAWTVTYLNRSTVTIEGTIHVVCASVAE